MKIILTFLITILILSACMSVPQRPSEEPVSPDDTVTSNDPDTNGSASKPYAPQPGDSDLTYGKAFVVSADLLVMESDPVQIMLELQGSLPTPCNQLRVVDHEPDEQNRIQVDVYSVIDSGQICVQVEELFEVNVGLGSFPDGHYTVWVNGEMAGEFDS
jgi:hypothetical protein